MQSKARAVSAHFNAFARLISAALGSASAFTLAAALILLWFIVGFIGGFSDSYQLLMNTGTTIVTFLMVFLIQNTTNRDTKTLNLKLDELTLALKDARNEVVAAEVKDDAVLEQIEADHKSRLNETT